MTEAAITITPGSGLDLHGNSRTITATTKVDQYVLMGEFAYASYVALAAGISIATTDSHVIQLCAGASLNVRVRSIRIEQNANATTASSSQLSLYRLSTAGTGGGSVTPRPYDTADSASGATAMTLPSSKGTESLELFRIAMNWRQTIATTGTQSDDSWQWTQHPGMKPIIIAAGTSNGLALKALSGIAGCTVNVIIEFVETAYV